MEGCGIKFTVDKSLFILCIIGILKMNETEIP